MRQVVGALWGVWLMMALAGSAAAQTADMTKQANLGALGSAMARQILSDRTGTEIAPDTVYGALTDLNTDGYPEVFAYRDPSDCSGPDCGLFLFSLDGKDPADLFQTASGIRQRSLDELGFINQKRGGYFELAFGDQQISWRGDGYALAGSFPATTLDTTRIRSLCEALDDFDFYFTRAGVDVKTGRGTICGCLGARFGTLGVQQDALDRYAALVAARADDDFSNDEAALEPVAALSREIDDARQGCMVQNGWDYWNWPFAQNDGDAEQVELTYDTYIKSCARADWLDDHRKVGSHARALGTCGCAARKLTANGFKQAELDAVGQLYAGDLAEKEVDAIRPDAVSLSDELLDRCLAEIPSVAAKAAD